MKSNSTKGTIWLSLSAIFLMLNVFMELNDWIGFWGALIISQIYLSKNHKK